MIVQKEIVENMERRRLICMVVCFLELLSAALAFGAEFKRIKESEIHFLAPGGCEYPRTPAFSLGLTAFVVLVVAHTIIHTSAGCFCCNLRLCSCAVFYAFMSWSWFALACIRLLEGSMVNDRHEMYSDVCYKAHERWIFVRGALWSLGSVTYGVLFYLSKSSIKDLNQMATPVNTDNHESIEMTQPPVLAQMTLQPVFVPEDTYNRRQQIV